MLLLVMIWHIGSSGVDWRKPIKSQQYYVMAIASIFLYTLVLGLRYKVGGDFDGYANYYETTTEQVASNEVSFEIGFYWLIQVLKFLELPSTALFLFTCCIQVILMTFWLRKYIFLAQWFFFFYFTTLLAFESLNLIRQAIAFMFILGAMPYLIEGKRLKYYLMIGLASTMHVSALLFLPLYFVLNKDWFLSRISQIILVLTVYISANVIKDYFFKGLSLLQWFSASEGYGSIQDALFFEGEVSGFSLGLFFTLITDLTLISASPWLKKKYGALGFRCYYNIFFIGALLTPIIYYANYITFNRLSFYFYSIKFVILSFLLCALFESKYRRAWKKPLGFIIVISYYLWFSTALFKGAAWCAPFQFVFQSEF